ncbi:hypothetical protein CPC08DRAFT_388359 [Agrocybe pediades]|nr:hypothetical protein CPC08DRAFT_388359 [Agrocybe pediades]
MSRKAISNLLSKVYGPYPEHIILNPDFPRAGVKPALHELQLRFNGEEKIIGFDVTEYITKPPLDSPVLKKEIVFIGILEIQNLDWLSAQGLKYLQHDFEEYDKKIHIEGFETKLPLERAYDRRKPEDPFLKVRICCRKSVLALYLTSKNDPEKLLISSEYESRHRKYWVKSLHAACYAASRNFLDRYRLRAAIDDLIERDKGQTPLEERTIDWLVRRYRDMIVSDDRNRPRMIPDLSPDTEDSLPPARYPRHVSEAEVRGYFAAHAEWLLAHQLAKQGTIRLLNIPRWIDFCKQVYSDSLEAARHRVRWGLAHGEDVDWEFDEYDLEQRLARFGQTEDFWRQQLLRIQRRVQQQPTQAVQALMPDTLDNQGKVIGEHVFDHDSDFSYLSSSSSDYTEDSDAPEPPPAGKARLLAICQRPPSIPNGRFVWHCPIPGCKYDVNLMAPATEQLRLVPPHSARILTGKSWKTDDDVIRKALSYIVSHHYELHLAEAGIRLARGRNGTVRITETAVEVKGDAPVT